MYVNTSEAFRNTICHYLICTFSKQFIPIGEEVFFPLQQKYGGGPRLKTVRICDKSLAHIEAYNRRKQLEYELVMRYDTKDVGDGQFWYLVDAVWVNQWKRYVKSEPVTDVQDMVCPLKVTNFR